MALYIPKINSIFLHIYKTAGTSIRLAMKKMDQNCFEISYGHVDYVDLLSENIEGKKIFSVVRNPYSWIYSLYQYGRYHNSHPFYAYCATHKFDEFVKWYFENIQILQQCNINGKLQTQTEYLSYNGEIKVDHILRMENLEIELNNMLSDHFRQSHVRLENVNTTPYEHKVDFKNFNKETISIINEKYKSDFLNFNYHML